jgi:hypothetical protein
MIQASLHRASTAPIPDATKNLARDLYLNGGSSQAAIAGELGIHPKTLSYWIKQNNWQEIKTTIAISPLIIRYNLYTQLAVLSEHIINREEGNSFPTFEEVVMQYKLVQAIFKFPAYTSEDPQQIYNDLGPTDKNIPAKKFHQSDKDSTQIADNQPSEIRTSDKDGIKMDKEEIKTEAANNTDAAPVDLNYIPKKNIVLRSGARWIEKGLVYDPGIKQNRKLRKPEWDELMRKGLTKADFQGWHPDY